MKPDFIGIGVQKCATAWLYRILSDHPQISMAMPEDGDKDTKFFSYFYDRGFEWYENHFIKRDRNHLVGEYSTSYFYNTDAPERIYQYSKEMKLILCLRHPVERAFSNHKHEIKHNRISGENIIFENGLKNNPMYLYQSLYYTHLSNWLYYFSKDQIFIIILDDIKENPKSVIQNLYNFLGVQPQHHPPMFNQKIHETRIPNNIVLYLLLKKISLFFKGIGLGSFIEKLKNKGMHNAIDKRNAKAKNIVFPPMEEKTRKYLLIYFKNENKKLGGLLNRDFSNWNN